LGLPNSSIAFCSIARFFGSSDHESFEIVPQFKKKAERKNKKKKKRKRKKNRRRTNVEEKEGD